jgi:hypothetical protein
MNRLNYQAKIRPFFAVAFMSIILFSCEGDLEQKVFDRLSTGTFFTSASDAKAAVTATYNGLFSIWGPSNYETVAQASMMTDELICSWGWAGWKRMNVLDLSEDFDADVLSSPYNSLMPWISEITINMDKISQIEMDEDMKNRLIAEEKALRAIYAHQLLNLYGPLTVVTDPVRAANPEAEFVPRPTQAEMVTQIEKDYKEAATVLPPRFTGEDYGRISGAACLTGLMHLYMHEKRWQDVITVGKQVSGMGYSLIETFVDNFTLASKGGNSEIILALPCRADQNSNWWIPMASVSAYVDPSGLPVMSWGGYKMPWPTYDKFDQRDERLARLWSKFPTVGGVIFDARANNYIGAIPFKFGPDPNAIGGSHGVDVPVYRYSDVLLMLAEAINEVDGPTGEAYAYIDQVRIRAGLEGLPAGLTKDQFRDKIMDERLFELWCDGTRRNDLIRWGKFIQRAIDAGSIYAKPEFVLYPLPRPAVTESNGIVKQNPGY